jgi:hypothetical protein
MLFSENVVPTTATRAVVAVATRRATVTKILLNAIIADRFVKDDVTYYDSAVAIEEAYVQ